MPWTALPNYADGIRWTALQFDAVHGTWISALSSPQPPPSISHFRWLKWSHFHAFLQFIVNTNLFSGSFPLMSSAIFSTNDVNPFKCSDLKNHICFALIASNTPSASIRFKSWYIFSRVAWTMLKDKGTISYFQMLRWTLSSGQFSTSQLTAFLWDL